MPAVDGKEVAAAADVVPGVRTGVGGGWFCSGVWKVDPPGDERSSIVCVFMRGSIKWPNCVAFYL